MHSEQGLSTSPLGLNPASRYSSPSEYSGELVASATSAQSHAISRAARAWMAKGGNDNMSSPTIEQDLLQQDGRRDQAHRTHSASSLVIADTASHSSTGSHYPSASPSSTSSLSSPLSTFASPSLRAFSATPNGKSVPSSAAATTSINRRHTKWKSGSGSSPGPSPPHGSAQTPSSISGGYYGTSSHSSSSFPSSPSIAGTHSSHDSTHTHPHHHHHHSHPYRSPRRHHAALPQNQQQHQQQQQPHLQYHYQRPMHDIPSRQSPQDAVDWQHSGGTPTHHRSGSDSSATKACYYASQVSSPRADHYSQSGPYSNDESVHSSRLYERRLSNSGQGQSTLPKRRSFGTVDSVQAQHERGDSYHYSTSLGPTDDCIACQMSYRPCDGRFPCGPCTSTNTRCMYQQHQPHHQPHSNQESASSTNRSNGQESSSPRQHFSDVAHSDHHMEVDNWEDSSRTSGDAPSVSSQHQRRIFGTNSTHLPPLYPSLPPPHSHHQQHVKEAQRRSSASPPLGSHHTPASMTVTGSSYAVPETSGFEHATSALSSTGISSAPLHNPLITPSSISPSISLPALSRSAHADSRITSQTVLPSIATLNAHSPSTSAMHTETVHKRVSSDASSPPSSKSPSPPYPMTTPSSRDSIMHHYSAADTSTATRATHVNSHTTSQLASGAQSLTGIVPSSTPGSSSPHAGQTGSQRTQKQRPILPFANPHVSRARSTSCSSSSSSTSRPPIPPPSQPAMASLSQGPTRNHPGRSNGPRRASYSYDPSNSNTSRSNRPPSPLPLIITLSSSSIRARKNALEMDNIQRASLLYSDFMTRIKESLNRPTHCSHQGVASADGIQSTQGTGMDETTVTSACSSTTTAAAIATTYLDSIHTEGHEGAQNSECIANIPPPPTIGFDPTAEATVALEDLAKTGMLHAMIQRYFEWVHPQFMIFNKNHFLLRFWSQYGPFPEARELNAKLQHALKQDNADEPSDDVSFLATGRSLGFLGERTCPLSPLLLWSMVALVARHIDDRENLKLPIQESQKRVREELALLNLADKDTSQRKQRQKSDEIDDVMMAENRMHQDGSESPTAIGANRTPENYKDRGEQYFRWATELLKEQHAESSLAVAQSLLLLHEYAVMAGLNSQASMYAGTAITMAMDLGWHKIKRHVPDNVAAAATSSTTATSIPSSESTTSITTIGSISADPPGFSRSATPSSNNTSSESMTSSTATTVTGSILPSDPPEGSSSTTSATSAVTTAKFQAATAAVVANPAMVATVTPSSSATVGQTKGKQVMEEEQRLCWGMCFIIDRWAAISAGRPFAIPIHVVDKSVFLTNLTPTAQQQKPKDDADSKSPMLKMPGLQMRTKIFYEQQCRQALVIDEIQQFLMTWTEDLFVNTNSFDRLAMALDNWYRALPPWLTLSNSNGSISIPTPSTDVNKPAINQDQQGETASSLPDIMRGIDWVGSGRGPEVKQLEALNKDIPLAILMDISYHTIRILLHRPFLRTNLRHPPCSPTRASFACAQSANAITGYAEQLLNHTVLSPSLLMRHLFIILTAAGIQLTNANLEDEPRLSTPAKINLLKSIRILRDSDCTSIGHERFMAILEEFFPNQMKVMYKRA